MTDVPDAAAQFNGVLVLGASSLTEHGTSTNPPLLGLPTHLTLDVHRKAVATASVWIFPLWSAIGLLVALAGLVLLWLIRRRQIRNKIATEVDRRLAAKRKKRKAVSDSKGEQIMDTSTTEQYPQQSPQPPRRRKWPRRLVIGVIALVLVGIGAGIGSGAKTTGISQATYNASLARVAALKSQVTTLQGQVTTLQGQVSTDNAAVTTAQGQAKNATATAEAKAKSDYAARNAALEATYKSKEAALASTQQTANSEAAQLKSELGEVQANQINSDGTFVVGSDIRSGTYHTNGSGNAGANDCYYATLSSTDGSINSIIANGNFDGPETISLSGVYAFQTNGPCTWNLVPGS